MLYSPPVEGSAMISEKNNGDRPKFNAGKDSKVAGMESQPSNKDNLWCTHCKKPRHTKEKCWKFHGKPQSSQWNRGPKSGTQRNQVHMTQSKEDRSNDFNGGEQNEFNKGDIERLRSLLDSLEKSTGTCSLANSGKLHSLYALSAFGSEFSNS